MHAECCNTKKTTWLAPEKQTISSKLVPSRRCSQGHASYWQTRAVIRIKGGRVRPRQAHLRCEAATRLCQRAVGACLHSLRIKQFCCIATCPAAISVVTQANRSVGAGPRQAAGLAVLDGLINFAAAARRLDRHRLLIPRRRGLRQDVRPHYLRAGTQAAPQAGLFTTDL